MKRLLLLFAALFACTSPDIPNMAPAASQRLSVADIRTDSDQRFDSLLQGATDNSVFASYNPDGPSSWGRNFTRRLNFTGVGWNDNRTVTLVSPVHVVMAGHHQLPVGSTAVFHGRDSKPYHRKIEAIENIQGIDIAVGKLDSPLPSIVFPYRVLPPSASYATLAGCLAVVTDQNRRAFIHEVSEVRGDGLVLAYSSRVPAHLKKTLIGGDSGNPSFLLVGGELVLVSTHTYGGPGIGPFYSSPRVFAAVNIAMTRLGGGHRLKVVPLAP